MPYYCTVPRCTSMAGKAKNVSFHQFPRDEELAKLWNRILKRGKPYTKYSKVCSLHFKPEDYTITSVGKNKGQWRTLRKDAIPSQNLPSESPTPYTRSPPCWMPAQPSLDPLVQQQMAQAIYMQTMLAMQSAASSESQASSDQPLQMPELTKPSPSGSSLSEIDLVLRNETDPAPKDVTYKCQECTKCFKDPDVFLLHKRTHKNTSTTEKENYSANIQDREETLRANPILANLLKTSMRLEPESSISNILTVENQIMTALASNMEAYIRTLTSMLSNQAAETSDKCEEKSDGSDYEETKYEGDGEDDAAKSEAENEDMCVDTNEMNSAGDENETKVDSEDTISEDMTCNSLNTTNENHNANSIECTMNTMQDIDETVLKKHSSNFESVNENSESNDCENEASHENNKSESTDKIETHETENHSVKDSDPVNDYPIDDSEDAINEIDQCTSDEMMDDDHRKASDEKYDDTSGEVVSNGELVNDCDSTVDEVALNC